MVDIVDQIIGVESGGNPSLRNPRSSAAGLGQFTDQTWLNTIRSHRPDLVSRYSPQELLALKTDPALGREMTGYLTGDNSSYLRSHGMDATPGNVYLAHFAGPQGASSVLSADPNAPVSSVLGPDAIRANPFLAKMSVADLRNWAGRKMGDSSLPAPSSTGAVPSTFGASTSSTQPQLVATGATAPAQPGADATAANPMAGIAGVMAALQPKQAPLAPPSLHINFPVPPGIARAQALARAMATSPLTGAA